MNEIWEDHYKKMREIDAKYNSKIFKSKIYFLISISIVIIGCIVFIHLN